jgi:hypothetical protein
MKNKIYISPFRFWLSCCFGILLLLAQVGVYAFGKVNEPIKIEKKHSKSSDHSSNPETSHFEQLTVTGVMPAVSFQLEQLFFHILFEIKFLEPHQVVVLLQKPLFRLSYFEKIFEHHIAPQAP